jgi:hypothetical protein
MNCCCCDAKVDITDNAVPAKWFGRYIATKLLQVICAKCIEEPEHAEKWRNDEFEARA